ncbi:hypothetical protein JCM8097_000453 [Rhodosporidiobolus ruineniae]
MRPSTSRLSTSYTAGRSSDRTPATLSPTGAHAGYAPFTAPLPGARGGPSTTAADLDSTASAMQGEGGYASSADGVIGLGVLDDSGAGWSRGGGYAAPPMSTSSSSSSSASMRPASPPLIRTTSLPSFPPIPGPSFSSSHRSPKSRLSNGHTHLRLEHSPTSPSRRYGPPPSLFARLLLAALPHRLLPTSITDPPAFQYPKSPSLTRDHPVKRHGSHRRGLLLSPRRNAIVVLLVLLVGLFALRGGSDRSRLDDLRGWIGDAEAAAAQRSWRKAAKEQEQPLPPSPSGPPPVEPEKVDYAALLEELRGSGGLQRTGPDVAERPSPGEEHAAAEEKEEEAGLAAIVSQAAVEGADVEAEAHEKLAMAKVVKPAPPRPAAAAAAEGPDAAHEAAERAAMAAAARKALDPKKKDPSRYKRLLPLGSPSRRYLYGANFILSSGDHDEEVDDPELTGKKVKVPSKAKLARVFEQGRKKYESEADGWRSYEWVAPPPHESLLRFLDKLEPDELALRDWIKRLHHQPSSASIGLSSSTPPSSSSGGLTPFPPLTPDLSLVASAPSCARGDLTKYADLLLQAEAGHAGKCQGATWLEDYRRMHEEMLDGRRAPKFISYHCEQGINCGGLGDRLLGMTSAFFYGLVTNRAFLAEWQTPIPLDLVFDSPHVNWSYSSFTSEQHPVLGQKQLVDKARDLDIIHFDRLSVDATFGTVSWNPKKGKKLTPGFEKRDLAYASPWIKFFTNRGMIYRSFRYKHLQKSINRLGLQPASAFACISQYLFKPKPPALDLISEYTSALALPTVFSVGIHIRTGDRSMKDAEYDKVNTVKRHTQFFRCAKELGATYAQPGQKVIFALVTDSAHLKDDAQRVFGDRLVTTDMKPQHVHQKSGHAEGVFSAVVEDWILAKADMLVATQDSGFGKLAAFMHAREKSTVTIFPRYNPDVMGLQSKKSHLKVDCTSPDVFTTFEELSSEWSLG